MSHVQHIRPLVVQRATQNALLCFEHLEPEERSGIRECEDDATSILETVAARGCSVLLLEAELLTPSLLNGLETIGHPIPKIVVHSNDVRPTAVEELIRLRCCGLISSQISLLDFRRMLTVVNDGEIWLGRKWISYVIRQLVGNFNVPGVSKRECEVLNLLQFKLKNREIAEALGISEETLRWHLRRLYAKTKQHSRSELVLYAQQRGLHESRPS